MGVSTSEVAVGANDCLVGVDDLGRGVAVGAGEQAAAIVSTASSVTKFFKEMTVCIDRFLDTLSSWILGMTVCCMSDDFRFSAAGL